MNDSVSASTIAFRVNGQSHEVKAYPMARLLDVLREDLRLTGTKEGCGEGECGACSVLMNGEIVDSCLIPVAQAHGSDITTIEGIASDPLNQKLIDTFVEEGGIQCGICTPGMMVAIVNLLKTATPSTLSDEQIRSGLAGNLCRCTGYAKIIEAVRKTVS